jgi:copper transport protein
LAPRARPRHLPVHLRRVIVAVVAVLMAATLLPVRAEAHAYLLLSTPKAGVRLASAPASVELLYSGPVALAGDGVEVSGVATAEPVTGAVARLNAASTVVTVTLPALGPGDYAVSWSVVSRDDGHISSGVLVFGVGPATVSTPVTAAAVAPTAGEPRDWAGMVATWLLLIGLAVAGGGLGGEIALAGRRRAEHPWRLSTAHLATAMTVALLGCGMAFAATAGRLADGTALHGLDVGTWIPALQVRAAFEDACMAGLVLNALATLVVLRDRVVPLLSLTGAMALVGLRSHPASSSMWIEAAMAVHVALALLWSGALAYLLILLGRRRLALRSSAAAEAIRRYGRLALLSVLGIIATGSAAALAELLSRGQLLSTAYGRLLAVKLLLVGGVLVIAGIGRSRGLRRGAVDALVVRRVARSEVFGVVLVLLTTAALANVPPPAPSVPDIPVAQSAP